MEGKVFDITCPYAPENILYEFGQPSKKLKHKGMANRVLIKRGRINRLEGLKLKRRIE